MARIFISYSRTDKITVNNIVNELLKFQSNDGDLQEIRWDQQLPIGDDWWRHILGDIQGSTHFVYFLSVASWESQFCNEELNWARALERIILPVQISVGVSGNILTQFRENVLPLQNSPADYAGHIERQIRNRPNGKTLPSPLPPRPARPKHPLDTAINLVERLRQNRSVYDSEITANINMLRNESRKPELCDDAILILEQMAQYPRMPVSYRMDIQDILTLRILNIHKNEITPSQPVTPRKLISSAQMITVSRALIEAATPSTIEEFAEFTYAVSRIIREQDINLSQLAASLDLSDTHASPRLIASELASDRDKLYSLLTTSDEKFAVLAKTVYDYCFDFLAKVRNAQRQLA